MAEKQIVAPYKEQFNPAQAANDLADHVEEALTDPSVLGNPAAFAERASEFRIDFNILDNIQQTLLRGRELPGGMERSREVAEPLQVGGSERDREAMQSLAAKR